MYMKRIVNVVHPNDGKQIKMERRKKILIAVILQMLVGITRYNSLNLQLIVASLNLVNLVLFRNQL